MTLLHTVLLFFNILFSFNVKFHFYSGNVKWSWRIDGGLVKTRRIPDTPSNQLPGRDITLCMCFLPNGLGTGGACVTGSSSGRITMWHQQIEQGAAKMIPRAT